jgi:hypothetical protein
VTPWPALGFPPSLILEGARFVRSPGLPRRGVVAQYREDVPRQSRHVLVTEDAAGRLVYRVDHVDAHNPHYRPVAHLARDVLGLPGPRRWPARKGNARWE